MRRAASTWVDTLGSTSYISLTYTLRDQEGICKKVPWFHSLTLSFPESTKNEVPEPIATLRNLNIVQNGKIQNLHFEAFFCGSQGLKDLKLLVFAGGPAFFSFWAIGIVVFKTLYL